MVKTTATMMMTRCLRRFEAKACWARGGDIKPIDLLQVSVASVGTLSKIAFFQTVGKSDQIAVDVRRGRSSWRRSRAGPARRDQVCSLAGRIHRERSALNLAS